MDNTSLSLILTALTTGAASGLKDTASQAVKDGYRKLKALLQKKLADSSTGQVALAEYESKPEIWKAPLEYELKTALADQDEDIITAAQQMLTLIQPQQAMIGKFNIQTRGNVGTQIVGDQPTITINTNKSE